MSRYRKPGPAPLPRATKETLADIQQRQTIAQMLSEVLFSATRNRSVVVGQIEVENP